MTVVRLPEKRKYRNRPGTEDGLRFDSQRELARYRELKVLQNGGKITQLVADKKQLRYELKVHGVPICTYVPDFQYFEKVGRRDGALLWLPVVEDVKGMRTRIYQIKKKLMKAVHGIEIREVE